ncbi:MAG: CPBP family glutamic-type intramembrane protease [Planctomycetota bacterium]
MPDDTAPPSGQVPGPPANGATNAPASGEAGSTGTVAGTPQAAALFRCPNCGRQFPAGNKFCPGCGRSRADLEEYLKAKRRLAQTDREVRGAWNRVRRVATFYVAILVLNFISAYVLPLDEAWGMLLADSAIIVVSLCWFFSDDVLRVASFRPGFSLGLLLFLPLTALLTYAVTVANNHLMLTALGLGDFAEHVKGTEVFAELRLPWPVLLVSICVVPGIFEEVFFRGLVQGSLEKIMTGREALLVQAVVFAIAHLNAAGFFTYLVFMGLYLGWLRRSSKSLIPGMLVHFSHNLIALLASHHGNQGT